MLAHTNDNDVLNIEFTHLTSFMVGHFLELSEDVKKDIIHCAWNHITSNAAVVKQTVFPAVGYILQRALTVADQDQKYLLVTRPQRQRSRYQTSHVRCRCTMPFATLTFVVVQSSCRLV